MVYIFEACSRQKMAKVSIAMGLLIPPRLKSLQLIEALAYV
jgi:hypothetical protein